MLLEGRAGDVGVGQREAGVVRFQRVAEADAGGGQGAEQALGRIHALVPHLAGEEGQLRVAGHQGGQLVR